jgi:hypothetical protein
MICFAVKLLKISPDNVSCVVRALRHGGVWAELAKQMPGYMGTSILESDVASDFYLVTESWKSKYDYFESEISPIGIFLSDVLHRMAYHHCSLGPFSFPPSAEATSEESSSKRGETAPDEFSASVEDVQLVRN